MIVEDPEWEFFETFCAGVIETVVLNHEESYQTSWRCAEVAARIIACSAGRRFLVKPEADDTESNLGELTIQGVSAQLQVTELVLQERDECLSAVRKWCAEVSSGLTGALSYSTMRSLVEGIQKQVEELKKIVGEDLEAEG